MATTEQVEERGIWVVGYAFGAAIFLLFIAWSQSVGYANWEHYGTGFIHSAWSGSANLAFLSFILASVLSLIGGIGLLSSIKKWGGVLSVIGILGDMVAPLLFILSDFLASFHGVIIRSADGEMHELTWSVSENLRNFLAQPSLIMAIVVIGAGILILKKLL